MYEILTNFANTESSSEGGVFGALGIDWLALGLQTLAFLILLWFLSKFVYPSLVKMLDKRDEVIEISAKAAREAQKKAENTEQEVSRMLAAAKREAGEIVTVAREEAVAAVEVADKKAKVRSEHIISTAKEQIDKDIMAAKKDLRDETMQLVVLATEKVIGQTMDGKLDEKVVKSAISEVA